MKDLIVRVQKNFYFTKCICNNFSFVQNGSVLKWIKAGCDPSKIIVGIPLYGRIFKLKDASKTNIGAPVLPIDIKGKYTQELGFLSTYEVIFETI